MAGDTYIRSSRFRTRNRLGAGSFGVVYEAYDCERETTVAVKVLKVADGETIYRFKREFRSLTSIAHPNLLKLFELVNDDENWLLVMELVKGVPLVQYVRRAENEAQRGAMVRHAFAQLACGLNALHHAGYLHRDLK